MRRAPRRPRHRITTGSLLLLWASATAWCDYGPAATDSPRPPVLLIAHAFHCPIGDEPGWPDVCDGHANSSTGHGCKPFAPLGHDGSRAAWARARAALRASVFGTPIPPPRNRPDVAPTPWADPVTFANCMCLIRGECPATGGGDRAAACARTINATTFGWNISVPVNDTYTLSLVSQVIWSLNTSGIAAGNSEEFKPAAATVQGLPQWPEVDLFPQARSDTLVLFHDGHAITSECQYDVEETVDWLNRLGYDVMHLQLPFHGCNAVANGMDPLHPRSHNWFAQFGGPDGAGSADFPFMRFFLEPVWLTVNYATEVLGYKRVAMAGLSGGGWTTHVAAALDTRIGLSLPVAGSVPCDFAHTSWDYEQFCDQPWAKIANYTSLYVLASLEPGRAQVQMLHEWDNCCFHGCGRHARIAEYNRFVDASGAGVFATAITSGNIHEVNERDRVNIALLIERFRKHGQVTRDDVARVPFSLIDTGGGSS